MCNQYFDVRSVNALGIGKEENAGASVIALWAETSSKEQALSYQLH
jgi:hypothetical protein